VKETVCLDEKGIDPESLIQAQAALQLSWDLALDCVLGFWVWFPGLSDGIVFSQVVEAVSMLLFKSRRLIMPFRQYLGSLSRPRAPPASG
jgi:hypothetical protein